MFYKFRACPVAGPVAFGVVAVRLALQRAFVSRELRAVAIPAEYLKDVRVLVVTRPAPQLVRSGAEVVFLPVSRAVPVFVVKLKEFEKVYATAGALATRLAPTAIVGENFVP